MTDTLKAFYTRSNNTTAVKYPVPKFSQAFVTKTECKSKGITASVMNSTSQTSEKVIEVSNCTEVVQLTTLIINDKYTLGTEFGPFHGLKPLYDGVVGYVLVNNSTVAVAIRLEPNEVIRVPFAGDINTVEPVQLVIPERFANLKVPVLWFWNNLSYSDYAESTGTQPNPQPNPLKLYLTKTFTPRELPSANPDTVLTPGSLFQFMLGDSTLLDAVIDKLIDVVKSKLGLTL